MSNSGFAWSLLLLSLGRQILLLKVVQVHGRPNRSIALKGLEDQHRWIVKFIRDCPVESPPGCRSFLTNLTREATILTAVRETYRQDFCQVSVTIYGCPLDLIIENTDRQFGAILPTGRRNPIHGTLSDIIFWKTEKIVQEAIYYGL